MAKHSTANVRLLKWMHRAGMTQTRLARTLGISDAHVSRVLAGSRVPSQELALKIETLADIPPAAWLPCDDAESVTV